MLTAFLVQRGSAESNDPWDEQSPSPRRGRGQEVPWPARRGGWVRVLYENSLALAFLFLFLVTFVLHGVSGAANYNAEQHLHGQPAISVKAYFTTAQFWFESFQNWQSELLAVGAMVVRSIFLRQKGSSESKDVEAAHSETGAEARLKARDRVPVGVAQRQGGRLEGSVHLPDFPTTKRCFFHLASFTSRMVRTAPK